jgi:molybdopterin-containing oxidoreductase family iron-sulfur binding subunit
MSERHPPLPEIAAAEAARFVDPMGRRAFLQGLGASVGASVALGACTRQPREAIVPYVKSPEEIVAGRPLFYATATLLGGVATGVLVESHHGRPTKVEGNPEHPASLGSTDAFSQATILDLYDPDRSQAVAHLGQLSSYPALFAALSKPLFGLRTKRGAGLRLLTGAVSSPTLAAQITALRAALPDMKWHWWEPAARTAARLGALIAFGHDLEPIPDLAAADVVLALDADFLSPADGAVRHVRDHAARRAAGAALGKSGALGATVPGKMSRLWVVEATATLTGAAADHRLPMSAHDVERFARVLARRLGAEVAADEEPPAPVTRAWLDALLDDLGRHRGTSLVIAGEGQPPSVHALAAVLNVALGNEGNTVRWIEPVLGGPPDGLASLGELVRDIDRGAVELLVVSGTNPVYTAPGDLGFADALRKVPLRVHHGLYADETAALCHWHVPDTHPLEAWSDARAFDGTVTVLQPLIAPLYEGKSQHELVGLLAEQPDKSGHDHVREHWQREHEASWARAAGAPLALGEPDFDASWRRWLHDGLVAGTARAPRPTPRPAADKLGPVPPVPGGGLEIVFRPDPSAHDGRFANNAWLQELPRPLTKLVWDNAALVAPATAAALGGIESGEIVELAIDGRTVKAPVWVMPGQPPGSVCVHYGYGRTRAGTLGNVGFDAYALESAARPRFRSGLGVRRVGARHELVTAQPHPFQERRDLARRAAVGDYRRDPRLFHAHEHKRLSLYPPKPYDGYAWGMTIDLNRCIGCSVCVVACQAENNIQPVGKAEVAIGREMHWLRIDRYYEGDLANPDTRFQPVPCMQCENAPCEVVCPVGATAHHDEGLNDMVYNRCVGTKYCANNCPYKVRRYNFFGYANEVEWPLGSRKANVLALRHNPDVTVRSYGVMEKCTYCVQRINYARIESKKEGRRIRDGEVMTACQAACPAEAITFGDINDPGSAVARRKTEPRNYQLLAELNTEPRTSYLAGLRNPHEALAQRDPAPEHG